LVADHLQLLDEHLQVEGMLVDLIEVAYVGGPCFIFLPFVDQQPDHLLTLDLDGADSGGVVAVALVVAAGLQQLGLLAVVGVELLEVRINKGGVHAHAVPEVHLGEVAVEADVLALVVEAENATLQWQDLPHIGDLDGKVNRKANYY
jgi:hypothetical protein